MKYIFLLAVVAISKPGVLLAHDGSGHVESSWYQGAPMLLMLAGVVLVGVLWAGGSYYFPHYRKIFAGIGVASILFGFTGFQMSQATPEPPTETVIASLTGVPVTLYRTEGCSCCSGYAKELSATGAEVTVQTISVSEMRGVKNEYGIAPDQESCHTSVIDGYVVEGHVPFEAIAKLVDERPTISGITLPGMPIGTPGMPGIQTEVYTVSTLDTELFWQSS